MKRPAGLEDHEMYVRCIQRPSAYIAFPSAEVEPCGVTYVRLVDRRGVECAMWTYDEWEEDPQLVMGAILGALVGGPLDD